jgi:glycerophosphoryl diester phosphodiesterase
VRRRTLTALTAGAALAAPLALAGALPATAAEDAPDGQALTEDLLVIGHRGASGYRPEHTLASYELAARMGADFIEPDLVATKDGVLVARHENEISTTTDVAERPEFADRLATKTVDGVELTGFFTEDFTLEELKTLRAVERLPEVREENTLYDGLYEVPTFTEVLALRERLSDELGREVGVYPETKHPTYFDGLDLSLEEPLVEALEDAGLDDADDPVFVQSFETTNLRELREDGVEVRLVQLLSASGAPADLVAAGDVNTYATLSTAQGLARIAEYADGVGPEKAQLVPREEDDSLGEPTTFVDDAHDAGLLVHPYTYRNENSFLPAELREGTAEDDYGRALDEQLLFWQLGVDGIFTDNPDTGVESRRLFEESQEG